MSAYSYRTKHGTFRIAPSGLGGWAIYFDGDNLGNYASASLAADDLAGGYCDWPSFGDPSSLGIPEDLGEWDRC